MTQNQQHTETNSSENQSVTQNRQHTETNNRIQSLLLHIKHQIMMLPAYCVSTLCQVEAYGWADNVLCPGIVSPYLGTRFV